MNKLINAKINLSKIDESKLFEGKNGKYLNVSIWINEKPDNYGNYISIQQRTNQGEAKIYIGEGNFYEKKESKPEEKPDNKEGEFVKESRTSAKQDIVDQSKKDAEDQDELSDLPF